MSRTKARELLMQAIFQMEAQKDKSVKMLDNLIKEKKLNRKDVDYLASTYKYLCWHLEDIDEMIDAASDKWKVKRMPKADLAILRLAVCEAVYCENIPAPVAVNEAVELAKIYGGEESPSFINGVMGKILKGLDK